MARARVPTELKKMSGAPRKYTDEYIEEMGRKAVEWAYNNETYWRLQRFWVEQKIPQDTATRWAMENKSFKESVNVAKSILLENLHYLIGTDQMAMAYACRMLRIIDKDYNRGCVGLTYQDEKAKEMAKLEAAVAVGSDKVMKIIFEDRPTKMEKPTSAQMISVV